MSSDLKPVEAVAFSPDGTTVAAASSDGTVQLWNAATQQEAGTTMAAGSAAVRALAFSPGGKFLAAGGDDGNVRLWDVATQSQVGATMATGAPVAALSFNAGGTTLATAESDGSHRTVGLRHPGADRRRAGRAGFRQRERAGLQPERERPGHRRRERDHRAVESGGLSPVLRPDRHRHAGITRGRRRPRAGRAQPRRHPRGERQPRHGPVVERPDPAADRPADRQPSRGDGTRAQPGRQGPGRGR